jgi:membrane protein DedA with SNARE-associated domain/membrane-associated phospholipid phosphatase
VLGSFTESILRLHGAAALAIVFLLPALEASAFLGFIFPGEIAVVLGGVLAFEGRIPLWAAIAAAVLGAIVGDSIGYAIGRRWGRAMLRGTLGRLPLIKIYLERNLDRAQAYVRRRRGRAVFFGRFTAALRVLVPGLAGMSEVHYPTFLAYNVAGGVIWGTGFVLLGYVAGAGYRRTETITSRLGLALLGLIAVGIVLVWLARAALPSFGTIGRRFPRQVAWFRRRLDPMQPTGLPLTFAVGTAALGAWAFGGLTQDVLSHEEVARFDPTVEAFILAHRAAWLTSWFTTVTWLGSLVVIVPLVSSVVLWLTLRRRDWGLAALLALAVGGAVALFDLAKALVERSRPPASGWIGHFTGGAFPSGHAALTVAFYGMAAVVLSIGRPPKARAWLWAAAAVLILAVGGSRIYLGAHWLTDVLGGYALGATWLAVLLIVALPLSRRGGEATPRGPPADAEPSLV